MIAFMTIIYVAAILLAFKVLRVPPRPWPIALFAVAGVLMLGTIVVLWTLAAPMSRKTVVTRYVIQIVPYEKGRVTGVPGATECATEKGRHFISNRPCSLSRRCGSAGRGARGGKEQRVAGRRLRWKLRGTA